MRGRVYSKFRPFAAKLCSSRILSIFSTSRSEKATSGIQSDPWCRLYFVGL